MTTLLIDYGMGNVRSVLNAFEALGESVNMSKNPEDMTSHDRIVLPGVGAFGDGMRNLYAGGWIPELERQVLEQKKPFLGICLGLQLLGDRSEEGGVYQGLGWFRGSVVHLCPRKTSCRVPHIGWNDVAVKDSSMLLQGLSDDPCFYFVHSYHLVPDDPSLITGVTEHGMTFASVLECENIFAVQFHPEKSQRAGLQLLRNFLSYGK